MRTRVAAGRSLIRIGRFVQSLAVMVMRPRDLLEFNRNAYSRPESVQGWSEDSLVDAGLSADEKALLGRLPDGGGKILVLGVGGGREAVALAAMGFRVTGVDFVPELAHRAGENARRRGQAIEVLVQDMSRLDVPESSYDAVWLTSGAYSSIPTRRLRLELLGRIRRSLRPGGHLLLQFLFSDRPEFRPGGELLRRAFSWLTLGNLGYARGDRLVSGFEYAHFFASAGEIRSELEAGGFEVLDLALPASGPRGGAVLRRDA
jgi:SAM-dependent methyltransferase